MTEKNCWVCGQSFNPTGSTVRYCSIECKRTANAANKRNRMRNARIRKQEGAEHLVIDGVIIGGRIPWRAIR